MVDPFHRILKHPQILAPPGKKKKMGGGGYIFEIIATAKRMHNASTCAEISRSPGADCSHCAALASSGTAFDEHSWAGVNS